MDALMPHTYINTELYVDISIIAAHTHTPFNGHLSRWTWVSRLPP